MEFRSARIATTLYLVSDRPSLRMTNAFVSVSRRGNLFPSLSFVFTPRASWRKRGRRDGFACVDTTPLSGSARKLSRRVNSIEIRILELSRSFPRNGAGNVARCRSAIDRGRDRKAWRIKRHSTTAFLTRSCCVLYTFPRTFQTLYSLGKIKNVDSIGRILNTNGIRSRC